MHTGLFLSFLASIILKDVGSFPGLITSISLSLNNLLSSSQAPKNAEVISLSVTSLSFCLSVFLSFFLFPVFLCLSLIFHSYLFALIQLLILQFISGFGGE